MLRTRVITAIIGIPLLLLIIFLGGPIFAFSMAVLAAIAVYEYCRLLNRKSYNTPYLGLMIIIGALVGFIAYIPYYILLYLGFLGFLALAFWMMYKKIAWDNFSSIFLGIIYIIIGFGSMVILRMDAIDYRYLLLAFIIAWTTDSGAYFVGRSLGKRKLAPSISPNKTIAGGIGGVVSALVFGGLYTVFFLDINLLFALILILFASIASQFGDLLESYLKRWVEAKDSGNILPGHGGVLDRFDSMMMIAPILYLALILPQSFMNNLF